MSAGRGTCSSMGPPVTKRGLILDPAAAGVISPHKPICCDKEA